MRQSVNKAFLSPDGISIVFGIVQDNCDDSSIMLIKHADHRSSNRGRLGRNLAYSQGHRNTKYQKRPKKLEN